MSDERQRRQRLITDIEELFQALAWRHQHRFAALLSTHGLTVAQFLGLAVLHRFGPEMTISEIGEMIQAPPSSMTSIVDRLERLGFIERRPHPTDRRATLARLTEPGLAMIKLIDAERHDALVAMLDGVPVDDLTLFLATLQQISAKGEATTSGPASTAEKAGMRGA
jgi:DNA-binding MarR family transcriptional regulator